MLVTELPWQDPISAFAALADDYRLAFLDGASASDHHAQVSYLCPDPRDTLDMDHSSGGNSFKDLEAWLNLHRPSQRAPENVLPFVGGAIGFLGYDLGVAAAGLSSRHKCIDGLPAGWFGLYDTVLGYDHRTQRSWFIGWDRPEAPAAARLVALRQKLAGPSRLGRAPAPTWRPEMSSAAYRKRLAKVMAYIEAGDIYQANLTLRFLATRPKQFCTAALYVGLRRLSPAPFSAYLSCGSGIAIVGASPERFLRLDPQGHVETRPIKGTARRGMTSEEDAGLAAGLLASEKDRAENLMIVDLMRNDISRVCEIGSVRVSELFSVEHYAQAHHLVSAVEGKLRPECGAIDLLRATFPGGSITGAPKIRAMQIIDEVEAGPRGAYCGAIAWIGFDGAMDSAITIRSIVATPSLLLAQAGGGIVWDSNAEAEYEEMRLKVAPLLEAHFD